MTRLASMIIPLAVAAAALVSVPAQAGGDLYERTGDGYKPADGARYSSSCCYKKITKRVVITRSVWVKVSPPPPRPRPHRVEADDDDTVETPRPAAHMPHHKPQVVELGEVVRRGDRCRKAVPVRDGGTTIVVMVNTRCR